MKTIRFMGVAVLLVGSGVLLHTTEAHQAVVKRTDLLPNRSAGIMLVESTTGSMHGSPLRETVTVAADKPIPGLAGKRLVSLIVDYPPGTSSAPHHHADSAFIYAYVVSGEIRSQVDDEPVRVYRAGESWLESPGAHHRVSANASATKPARLLAVFIVDAADEQLTTSDTR